MHKELSKRMRDLNYLHRVRAQKFLDEFDLYVGQPSILFRIQEFPGITQKELIEKILTSKESVSVSLRRLEAKGLVVKKPTERDRRINELYLTEKGNELTIELREDYNDMNAVMYSRLTDKQKKELLEMYDIMIATMKER